MKRWQIDRLIGQTPCLCGDIRTWHPECYKGKSKAQISKEYTNVYALVRRWLETQRLALVERTIRRSDRGNSV